MFTVGFAELVARQAGVVSIRQAVAAGVPPRTVQRWARTWRRLHPGVYLVAGHRLTPEGRARAALLWAGGDAVLTGQAAAHWHGLPAPAPATMETTVAARRKPRSQPGVTVRRRDLHRVDVSVLRGIRVAAPPPAALETAVVLREGSVFLDRVLQRHVSFPELYRCFARNIGCHGSSAAGKLITAAADRADSAAERLLTGLLRQAGITGWRVAEPFGLSVIDIAFPEVKVAIEVDGWAWHADADRFRATAEKATRPSARVGHCSASPGTTSPRGLPSASPKSLMPSRSRWRDQRGGDMAAAYGTYVPTAVIMRRT